MVYDYLMIICFNLFNIFKIFTKKILLEISKDFIKIILVFKLFYDKYSVSEVN